MQPGLRPHAGVSMLITPLASAIAALIKQCDDCLLTHAPPLHLLLHHLHWKGRGPTRLVHFYTFSTWHIMDPH